MTTASAVEYRGGGVGSTFLSHVPRLSSPPMALSAGHSVELAELSSVFTGSPVRWSTDIGFSELAFVSVALKRTCCVVMGLSLRLLQHALSLPKNTGLS